MKKELHLEGLTCVNCASKIQTKINEIEDVQEANLNFISKTLNIQVDHSKKMEGVIQQATTIIKEIEPDVRIIHREEDSSIHTHNHDNKNNYKKRIPLAIGIVLYIVVLSFSFVWWMELTLFVLSYLAIGGEILLRAAKNISRGQIFDENFLMSLATLGAFAIGEYPEGVAVMLFYQIGEFFQDLAVNRSRKSIKELMGIRPDYANLKVENKILKVDPKNINVGDYIVIKPGEKVPLDGNIVEGESMVDTSALTGESLPRKVAVGEDILSGFVNKNGILRVKVTKSFGQSTVAKILDLVENAAGKKAPTEQFMTKFSRYYTPVVVYSALALALIPPLVLPGATFSQWLYRALIFLVVSCPCALVVSIPLGFFGGIGGASKKGILVKGGNYLEALNQVDTIVMDKTGTLTKGVFEVTNIQPQSSLSKEELLEYAAYAESYSSHPIAQSIVKSYGKNINQDFIENYSEISGLGIKTTIKGQEVLVGNDKLMDRENILYKKVDFMGSIVHIAIEREYKGYIIVSDEIKKDAKETISSLRGLGVKKIVMLTGDHPSTGQKVAMELGLDEVFGGLLPHEKVEKIELLEENKDPKSKLIFVGDGINDAPVLARADIGVAMGGLGSDAAIEAADVVLMTDEPSKLVTAIKIAKRTRKIVMQNIVLALGIKAFVLLLGAFGIATMWEAVFADVGVSLLAILNSLRVLNIKNL